MGAALSMRPPLLVAPTRLTAGGKGFLTLFTNYIPRILSVLMTCAQPVRERALHSRVSSFIQLYYFMYQAG